MHFLEWKCLNSDWNFIEVCSLWSNWQYSSIGSDIGLAPSRRQAIIWTNVGWFTDAYMRHSASMSYEWEAVHHSMCQESIWYLNTIKAFLYDPWKNKQCFIWKCMEFPSWFIQINSLRSGGAMAKSIIIGSDNSLSPVRCQAIIRSNADILLDHKGHFSMEFYLEFKSSHSRRCIWKCGLQNVRHFDLASIC